MSELASSTPPDFPSELDEKKSRLRAPQIGLSTLFLTTACLAAWGSVWFNQRQVEKLEAELSSMRKLSRELVIKDREHIAVVQQHAEFYDEQIWHVFVPNDSLGLHLVTRDIPPASTQVVKAYEGSIATAPLRSGQHVIELKSELEGDQWITQVFIDDQPAIAVREPKDWDARRGSSGGGHFAEQADVPIDQPVVLFDRVFMVADGPMQSHLPTGPSNGIVLWIDELQDK